MLLSYSHCNSSRLLGSDGITMTAHSSLYLRLKVNGPAVIYQLLPPLDIHEPGSPVAVRDPGATLQPCSPACPSALGLAVALRDDGSVRAETKTDISALSPEHTPSLGLNP